jgi:colanic acid/amylovoran biosynthesis glycosyltransferase
MMSAKKDLKIAFITENFPKLSETFVLFKAVALEERGHQVWIFTQKIWRDYDIMHEQVRRVDLKRRVIKLPVSERVRFKDLARGLAQALIRHPLRVIWLALRIWRDERAKGDRVRRFNLALPFLRERFDIITPQFGNCGAWYYPVQDSLGIPFVVFLQGNDILVPPRKLLPAYQKMFETVPRFLPNCHHLLEEAHKMGCPPDKLEVYFIEKDLDLFSYIDRSSRRGSRPVILTAARLYWRKGYIYALEAMRILKQRGIEFEYWIAGDGEQRNEIELGIKDFDIGDRVKMLGAKNNQELCKVMHGADIFLLTSVSEGLGAVVSEAHATGLPVVATRVGGIPECMLEGETGLLAESRDSMGLADHLQYLIEHPEIRWEMGRKARRFVEENFEQGMLIDRLIKIYQEVIQEWQKSSSLEAKQAE